MMAEQLMSHVLLVLLSQARDAARTAISCRKECQSLQDLLQMLEPSVRFAIQLPSTNTIPHTHHWLQTVKTVLEEAEAAVKECDNRRYFMTNRIRSIADRIKDLCEQVGPVILAEALSHGELQREMLGIQRETLQQVQHLVSINTHRTLFAPGSSPEIAYNKIRRLISRCSSWIRSGGMWARSSSSDLAAVLEDVESVNLEEQRQAPQMLFGLDRQSKELQNLLLSSRIRNTSVESQSCVVGIWGPGGAGKTLLAQVVATSREVKEHFGGESNIHWITVGQNPSIRDIYITLGKRLGYDTEDLDEDSIEGLKKRICERFEMEKTLVVLDDVWDEKTLQQLPFGKGPESITLLTSRIQSILDGAGATKVMISLLSEEDSWRLFCAHAFGGENVPGELEDLAKSVVAECKNLPLALKVVGGAMTGKRTREQWSFDLLNLKNSKLPNLKTEAEIYGRLELSLKDLDSIDLRVKQCFLYFAAFPEDYQVPHLELFELWKAEGMLGGETSVTDAKEVSYYLVGLLVGRSLIEFVRCDDDEIAYFKVHDVLRDLAQHILRGRGKGEVHKMISLFEPGRDLEEFPRAWMTESEDSSLVQPLAVCRMSLMVNRLATLPSKLHAPSLQTLLLQRNYWLKHIPNGFLECLQNLRILNLSESEVERLPKSIGNLKRLVHLDLNSTKIKKLPKCIGNLKLLEHLDLRWTKLTKLPKWIPNLQKLNYLNLGNCENLLQLPVEIRQLRSLLYFKWTPDHFSMRGEARLKCWDNMSDSRAQKFAKGSLENVGRCMSLTSLHINCFDARGIPWNTISKLTKLEELRLEYLYDGSLLNNDAGARSFEELRRLTFLYSDNLRRLPQCTTSFTSLTSLKVEGCHALDWLPALDVLPNLLSLVLHGCYFLEEFPASFGNVGAFPQLQSLEVRICGLKAFPVLQEGAMPKLLHLQLLACEIKKLHCSIEMLTSLRTLDLRNTEIQNLEEIEFGMFINLQRLLFWTHQKRQLPSSLTILPSVIFQQF